MSSSARVVTASLAGALLVPTLLADPPPRWAYDFLGPGVMLPDGRSGNSAVRYWNDVVGVPFSRDFVLEIPPTPLDLNQDGVVDTTFSGHWELPGGILGNPEQVGLVRTPDDPAGTVGEFSVSTGFLGVREELDPATRRGTRRYGFNCWLCHGAADQQGQIVLGQPNANIHLGLIMASSTVLDDAHAITDFPGGPPLTAEEVRRREGLDASFAFDRDDDQRVTIAEWRAAMKLPPAAEVRSLLMLAGPGRLDQSIDHRMDGTIPLAQMQHYDRSSWGEAVYLRRAKGRKRSLFNPVSIPQNVSGLGVAHYSWSGKDSSLRVDAVKLLVDTLGRTPSELAAEILFSYSAPGAPSTTSSPAASSIDYEALSRALTLDLRNVATAGKETDTIEGMGWPAALLTRPTAALLHGVPPRYDAIRLRSILTPSFPLREEDDSEWRAGRRIFFEETTGVILNQRVVIGRAAHVPAAYRGIAVLAPLDRSQPPHAKIAVRCASCHSYSPLSERRPIRTPLSDAQRCDNCHFDHPIESEPGRFQSLAMHMAAERIESVDGCVRCHAEHPDFGPPAWSNSWLLPFDGDGDGQTQGDERDDAAAGAIGSDAYLNLDTNFSDQLKSAARRPAKMFMLTDNARAVPENPKFSRAGTGFVRVAPLIHLRGSAPYLHNGSVPTLAALLAPPPDRPRTFSVGSPQQRFTFDTALPGNYNGGHDFGTRLTDAEKAALRRFLESLP